MNHESRQPSEPALIAFINRLKANDDRGTLALLRGALSDAGEKQIRAWRVLAQFGGIPAEDPHKAEVVRTVAGLLALPKMTDVRNQKNFGHACLRLLGDDERKSLHKSEQPGPVARRMQHLLSASRSEVCERVRRLARQLDKAECNLDFAQLYADLLRWNDRMDLLRRNDVKGHWALAFWGAESETQELEAAQGKEVRS